MKKLLPIGLLIVALFLLFTNPDRNDFRDFIENTIVERSRKAENGKPLLAEFLARPASWLANELTVRKNYVLFSIYEVYSEDVHIEIEEGNLKTEPAGKPSIIFLGLGDRFVKIKGDKDLEALLQD